MWKRGALRLRQWRSCDFRPSLDGLVECLYRKKLNVACDVGSIVQIACEFVHAMENAVHGCDSGLGEVMMPELHRVRDLCRACGFCHNCVAAVVLQRYTDIPACCTVGVPRMSCPCLFVCHYVTSKGPNGCGVIIENSVEV